MSLKSSQLYMVPILFMLMGYFIIVRRWKIAWQIAAFTGIPMFLYATYNYCTFGEFTPVASTILKLEDTHRVFSETEQAFFYKIGANLPAWHPIYKIHHSSNLDTLQQSYLKARWGSTLKKDTTTGATRLHVTFEMKETVNVDSIVNSNPAFTAAEREWYATNKNGLEDQFINFYPRKWKRFETYVWNYFFNLKIRSPLFYYSEVKWRYENFFITHAWTSRYDLSNPKVKEKLSFLLREYYMPNGNMDEYNKQYEVMTGNAVFKLYDVYNLHINAGQPGKPSIAKNVLWVYGYFFLSILIVILYLFHFRNPHLFFLLVLVLIHFGSCLLHAIWGDPINRYSLATEFVPYFLWAFAPLFFLKSRPD